MDKNKSMIDFIKQCRQLINNKLFFNFIQAKDNNKVFETISEDIAVREAYVDGSIMKRYTFTLLDFRSAVYQALVTTESYNNENVEDMYDVQGIIDWVKMKDDAKEYPDFGENCVIERIYALSETPSLNGIDTTISPPLAKYSVSIRVEYLDKTDMVWNK